ncbi:hypothetical protein A2U01_0080842, partial [Trifolium medium]|nr:hypothetical protein [Trifolium medium]
WRIFMRVLNPKLFTEM